MADIAMCRRCLLRDMPDSDYHASVEKYRAGLPRAVKTPEPEYQRRLAACTACDALENGVCCHCGCYVEMRAAAVGACCPLPGGGAW